MPSNSLLDNRYFNKLAVNRLKAQAIRSDNIQPSSETISYLFSVLLENGTFQRNNTGGTLTFDLNVENNEVIKFSDRPFRQTNNININTFVTLFTLGGTNSFEKDPPNIVVAHSEEQRTYIMKLSSHSNNQVIFNLELLPGETHNLETVTGSMNLFVDDYKQTQIPDDLNLSGENLRNVNLEKKDLAGVIFSNANLTNANLTGANLAFADLTDANLTGANLAFADLTAANLTDANLTNARLTDANLFEANLTRARLNNANLTRADLRNANLGNADLRDANLGNANLGNADLTDAKFTRKDLTGAILTGAILPTTY